jgi:hypothetical protein
MPTGYVNKGKNLKPGAWVGADRTAKKYFNWFLGHGLARCGFKDI